MKFILLSFIILISDIAFAGKIKVRAREHYELLKIKTDNTTDKYKGLSNTVNIWWEEPYEISYGISISPILSSLREEDDNSTFGKKIKTINAGVELKYFPKKLFRYLYLRPGLSYTILKPDKIIANRSGYSAYLGLGYEIPFKKFGLALEFAYRYSELEMNTIIETITPSIGLHFYSEI